MKDGYFCRWIFSPNNFPSLYNEGNKKLIISLEVQKGETAELLNLDKTQVAFFENLSKINQDFREAKKMLPNNSLTAICFENFGSGSFKENDIRIKAKYISDWNCN